eukprot:scaffold27416_cov129-Isochrysis_galbana.AAC.2
MASGDTAPRKHARATAHMEHGLICVRERPTRHFQGLQTLLYPLCKKKKLKAWASHISAHTNYGCTSWNLRRGALLIIAVALSADAQARWCLRDGGG